MTGITACRMDRKRGVRVADEIVDGGLRIPKGWPGGGEEGRHDRQDEEENPGLWKRKVWAASGDYGWP